MKAKKKKKKKKETPPQPLRHPSKNNKQINKQNAVVGTRQNVMQYN